MANVLSRLTRPPAPTSRESVLAADTRIVRATAARPGGALRVKWARLDPAEVADLVELSKEIAAATGKRRRRFEALLERGCDLAPGSFEAERKTSADFSKIADLARRASRVTISRKQEDALLAAVWRQVTVDRALHLRHLGVLTFVLASFRAGEALGAGGRFEVGDGGERVLVYDARFGLAGYAGGAEAAGADKALKHLQRNNWVKLSRRGPRVEVRLGVRATRILREAA